MNKLINGLLFSLAVFIFSAVSFTVSFASSDLERETIIVGYEPNYGMIEDIDSIDFKGYGYELFQAMEEYTNYDFEFVSYSQVDALQALENGEIDVFGPITYTNERNEKYSYTSMQFLREQIILVAPKDRTDYYYNDPISLNGSSVSLYQNSPENDHLHAYANSNDIQLDFLYSTDNDTYYYREDADLYLVSSLNIFLDYQTILNLGNSSLFLVTNKDNPELAHDLDNAYTQLLLHDSSITSELFLKYYSSSNMNQRSLTRLESEDLMKETLTVGYSSQHYPLQYNDENGVPSGISVEIINHLAETYGFSVEYITFDPTIPEDLEKNFDLTLFPASFLSGEYSSTDHYVNLPMMLIGKEYLLKSPNSIGMMTGIPIDLETIESAYPNSKLSYYTTLEQLLMAYQNGSVETILLPDAQAYYATSVIDDPYTKIQGTQISLPLRVYVDDDGENNILSAFETMINRLDSHFVDEIVISASTQYLQNDYRVEDFLIQYSFEIIIFGFTALMIILIFVINFQRRKRSQLTYVANHDDVTDLISIQYFRKKALKLLKFANPSEYEIITMDIDYFRIINDTFGYDTGTSVIKSVAKILPEALGENALVSRVTGDQFVVIRKFQEGEPIDKICEKRLSDAVKEIIGRSYNLTMSVGMFVIDDNSEALNVLIDRANIARAKGKSIHKNTYILFDSKMKSEYETRTDIVFHMEAALENQEFYLVYQPKINLQTLEIDGAEALVRWRNFDGKTIFPNDFIPVFEANGFSTELDLYVFENVCKFIAKNKNKMKIPTISVNLSGKSVLVEGIELRIIETLIKYEVDPSLIEIEITESALIDESNEFCNKVKTFTDAGFALSMDDFGAGASSLNRLNSLDVDVVKLDRVFLESNNNNSKGSIIVQSVIDMVKELDMKVVSEGVETREQAIWLQGLECNLAQGYFFERPLEEKDFIHALETGKTYSLFE